MPIPTTAPPQCHHELLCGTQATALGDQAVVPPQDSAWRDRPVRPQVPWQEPDKCGKDRAVGPVQLRPGMGSAQHSDLVPQHQQLGILGCGRAAEQDKPAA